MWQVGLSVLPASALGQDGTLLAGRLSTGLHSPVSDIPGDVHFNSEPGADRHVGYYGWGGERWGGLTLDAAVVFLDPALGTSALGIPAPLVPAGRTSGADVETRSVAGSVDYWPSADDVLTFRDDARPTGVVWFVPTLLQDQERRSAASRAWPLGELEVNGSREEEVSEWNSAT